jgi:hypothetical protein
MINIWGVSFVAHNTCLWSAAIAGTGALVSNADLQAACHRVGLAGDIPVKLAWGKAQEAAALHCLLHLFPEAAVEEVCRAFPCLPLFRSPQSMQHAVLVSPHTASSLLTNSSGAAERLECHALSHLWYPHMPAHCAWTHFMEFRQMHCNFCALHCRLVCLW